MDNIIGLQKPGKTLLNLFGRQDDGNLNEFRLADACYSGSSLPNVNLVLANRVCKLKV